MLNGLLLGFIHIRLCLKDTAAGKETTMLQIVKDCEFPGLNQRITIPPVAMWRESNWRFGSFSDKKFKLDQLIIYFGIRLKILGALEILLPRGEVNPKRKECLPPGSNVPKFAMVCDCCA